MILLMRCREGILARIGVFLPKFKSTMNMDLGTDEQDQTVANTAVENDMSGKTTYGISLCNIDDFRKERNLLHATESGDCDRVIEMLSSGVSVEVENLTRVLNNSVYFMTPLQIAAANGHVDCVQILIDHGANVHTENKFGYTALHLAARNGHFHCIKKLLNAGADCPAPIGRLLRRAEVFGNQGTSALHLAAVNNHVDCIQELIKFGADCTAIDENGHSCLYIVAQNALKEYLSAYLKNVHRRAITDTPYLSLSFRYRMMDCVRKLILVGSDENEVNSNGFSPLPVLLSTGFEDVDAEIYKLFVLESYKINRSIPRGLKTLRHLGFEYYNSKIATILITCGADVVIKESCGVIGLLEHLFRVSGGLDTLEYVVKCMPRLPRLKSLHVFPVSDILPEQGFYDENSILNHVVLPDNVEFVLMRGETGMYVEVHDRKVELSQLELVWDDIIRGIPIYGRYPLQQPLMNLIYERISDEIDQLTTIVGRKCILKNHNFLAQNSYRLDLCNLKKHLWYELISSNPPSLQQCCRFSVLKCIGPLNVEHIRKLSVPEKLLSYLLFKCDK